MRILTLAILPLALTACAGTLAPPQNESRTASALPDQISKGESSSYAPVPLHIDDRMRVLDLDTGKEVPGHESSPSGVPVFSADGRRFVVVETNHSLPDICEPLDGGSACRPAAQVLDLVDVATWNRVTVPLEGKGWAGALALNADGSRLALDFGGHADRRILLADGNSGKIIAERAIELRPQTMFFQADGKTLAVYGQEPGDGVGIKLPPAPRVMLLDAESLQVVWEETLARVLSGSRCQERCDRPHEERLTELWQPAVIPSHDGNKLLIVHADSNQLTTVDLVAHAVDTARLERARSWIERILELGAGVAQAKGGTGGVSKLGVISADGSRLWVVNQKMFSVPSESHGFDTQYSVGELVSLNTENGEQLALQSMYNLPSSGNYVNGIQLTPDGKHVYVVRSEASGRWWTEVYDAVTLKPVAKLETWHLLAARDLEGQPILLAFVPNANPGRLAVVGPRTFKVTRTLDLSLAAGWVSQ